MKNSFLCTVVPATLLCAVSFADSMSDWAKSELSSSRDNYERTLSEIERERAAELAETEKISAEIKSLDNEIAQQREILRRNSSLLQLSKFYDGVGVRLAETPALFDSTAVFKCSSVSEAAVNAEKVAGSSFDLLVRPCVKRNASVRRARSGEILEGKMFSVGAFSYFVGGGTAGFLSPSNDLYGEKFSAEIVSFSDGKTDLIPADVSNGKLLDAEKNSRSFAEDVALGGIWMYPILLCGFLSILVGVAKILSFLRIRRAPKNIVKKILDGLDSRGDSNALAAAKGAGYPYSKYLSELVGARKLDASMIEEISYEGMLEVGESLFSGLSVLSVSAAVAPLFGLLGTVTGIIKTFADLSARGTEQAQFISAGIGEALITTEYGLVVAIPAFVAHAILSRRAKAVLSDMEKLASAFLAGNSKK